MVLGIGYAAGSLPPAAYPESPYYSSLQAPSYSINSTDSHLLSDIPLPLLVMKYNETDPFQKEMLSESSLDDFFGGLGEMAGATSFLFSGYDVEMTKFVENKLRSHSSFKAHREQFYFAEDLDTLELVLSSWSVPLLQLSTSEVPSTPRLDCMYGKCAWPNEVDTAVLIDGGAGCDDSTFPLRDSIPDGSYLLLRPDGACTPSAAALAASRYSTFIAGVVVAAADGEALELINSDADVDGMNIVATMIPHETGEAIHSEIVASDQGSTTLVLNWAPINGAFLSIGADNRLMEVGWEKIPIMKHLSYAASFLEFKMKDEEYLAKFVGLNIPVFQNDVMQEKAIVKVKLPYDRNEIEKLGFNKLELDFALGCDGTLDSDCSVWDHVISLTLLGCSDSMLGNEPGGDPSELGRWITTFRRRVGRWRTDATSLFPMIWGQENNEGGERTCSFQIQTESEPWRSTLNLLLSRDDEKDGAFPTRVEEVVYPNTQVNFDSRLYNENRTYTFSVDSDTTKRVTLRALITGHGNCEFLPTSHWWSLNGGDKSYDSSDVQYDNYMEAGMDFGCADRSHEGAVPNEHGTWYYGRNGWCDGMQVEPLEFDITKDIMEGENVLEYGAFSYDVGGGGKSVEGCGGYMLMSTKLIFT